MLDTTIPHALYEQAITTLSKEMAIAKPGKIIAFIGHSGAGKSHIRKEVEEWLINKYRAEMSREWGC